MMKDSLSHSLAALLQVSLAAFLKGFQDKLQYSFTILESKIGNCNSLQCDFKYIQWFAFLTFWECYTIKIDIENVGK